MMVDKTMTESVSNLAGSGSAQSLQLAQDQARKAQDSSQEPINNQRPENTQVNQDAPETSNTTETVNTGVAQQVQAQQELPPPSSPLISTEDARASLDRVLEQISQDPSAAVSAVRGDNSAATEAILGQFNS